MFYNVAKPRSIGFVESGIRTSCKEKAKRHVVSSISLTAFGLKDGEGMLHKPRINWAPNFISSEATIIGCRVSQSAVNKLPQR